MAAQRETGSNEHQKAGSLDRRGNKLRAAAPADSSPLQNKEYADNADRSHRLMPREHGEKIAAVLCNDYRDRSGSAARREPVAPSDDEASILADGAARKIVLSSAAGNRCAKLRERGGAEKRVQSADNPNANEEPAVRNHFRDVAGRAHNARTDGVANGYGDAEPHTEYLQQLSVAARCARGCGDRAGGRLGRCVRQCGVSGV